MTKDDLLDLLDEGYSRKAWHGPNLLGAIRGLSDDEAAWRPGRNRHSIREIVVHCAYWKYAVRRRITAEKRGSFPMKGSNWFPQTGSASGGRTWKEDVRLLKEMHRRLAEAVAAMPDGRLGEVSRSGSPVTIARTISGIALHDVYHTGQIQVLKRLMAR